jgi:hypothetical protein
MKMALALLLFVIVEGLLGGAGRYRKHSGESNTGTAVLDGRPSGKYAGSSRL